MECSCPEGGPLRSIGAGAAFYPQVKIVKFRKFKTRKGTSGAPCAKANQAVDIASRHMTPCNHEMILERVKGIEPSYSAWKAAALPLSYTR